MIFVATARNSTTVVTSINTNKLVHIISTKTECLRTNIRAKKKIELGLCGDYIHYDQGPPQKRGHQTSCDLCKQQLVKKTMNDNIISSTDDQFPPWPSARA